MTLLPLLYAPVSWANWAAPAYGGSPSSLLRKSTSFLIRTICVAWYFALAVARFPIASDRRLHRDRLGAPRRSLLCFDTEH
jgi:hypothetical protein